MRNDLDDNAVWITVTQSKLERIIKKPKLTVKLLSRPPFRFIHDIVMENKTAKLRFLERLIQGVSQALDDISLDVEAVAGLEPEKTNDLLVCLSDAALRYSKPDSQTAAGDISYQTNEALKDVISFSRLIRDLSRDIQHAFGESEKHREESLRLLKQLKKSSDC